MNANEIAARLLNSLCGDNGATLTPDDRLWHAMRIAAVIAPAVRSGWAPDEQEIETLCCGEMGEMERATTAIPANCGDNLHNELEMAFESLQ